MRRGALGGAVLTVALLFAFSGVASADVTLGTTTQPAGSTVAGCFTGSTDEPDVFVQATDDPDHALHGAGRWRRHHVVVDQRRRSIRRARR